MVSTQLLPPENAQERLALHKTMHGHVVDQIGRMVVRASHEGVEALPTEPELVEMLGVSRGAVREAVKSLVSKGMIDVRPRTGTRMRPRQDWNMLDPAVLRWSIDGGYGERLLADLAGLRAAVEPPAASLAAIHAEPEAVAQLWREFIAMESAAMSQNRAEFVAADGRFHQQLLQVGGNELFGSLGKAVEAVLYSSFTLTSATHAAVMASVPLHRSVLLAVSSHDAAGAADAMLAVVSAGNTLCLSPVEFQAS